MNLPSLADLFAGMTQQEIAAWFGAVGSIGAAMVPLIFFLFERRDRRRAERERQEVEDRYRALEVARQRVQDERRSGLKPTWCMCGRNRLGSSRSGPSSSQTRA